MRNFSRETKSRNSSSAKIWDRANATPSPTKTTRENKNMRAHTVHAVRFYKPRPKACHTLAFSPQRKLLALSREDGSIEIYNFQNPNAPLLQSSIVPHGSELDRSVEALAFVEDGRLFSVGLHGFVYQHFVCALAEDSKEIPEFWPVTSGNLNEM